MSDRVLFIVGPTAAGKSAVAMEIARRIGGEIISADSMQVYRGMNIGTAKATPQEQKQIPHHLLDIKSPSQSFSVHDYYERALGSIQDVHSRGRLPIVVGGTGLYVRALLEGMEPGAVPDPKFRRKLEKEIKSKGLAVIYQRLKKHSPEKALKIKPQDKKRIIRALEILKNSGKKKVGSETLKPLSEYGFQPFVAVVNKDRSELYQGIERRVDQMFDQGWIREAKKLPKRLSKTASQALGYREIREALSGRGRVDSSQVRDLKSLIKKNTRHLAKRQLTWFRHREGLHWYTLAEGEGVVKIAEKILKAAGIQYGA